MPIRILLLGSGGREHALVWKLAQSILVDRIYVCPGNGGTSGEPKASNLDLPVSDFPKLVQWAVANEVRNSSGIRSQFPYALSRSHLLFRGQSNL